MKSRVKKRVIALMLCMVMVLSSGISTLAEGDAGTPEATEEISSTNDESAVNTEPDTAVAEESQSRSNTDVETETAAEENAPAEAEAQPKTAEAAPAENTEADAAAQTPVEETQTAETKDNAADAQSTEQSAENGEAVQEETTTPETENETAQNTETAPQPYEGKYEDDTIKITVNAEAGIVPEGAELSVTPIEKTKITDDMTAEEKAEAEKINEQYDLTEKKLNEDSEENEETMEGFLAYDISFLVNGEEVEPSGDVNVVMEFKEAAIPEGVSEDADVTVKHLKEDESAEDGVVVEDMADKAEVQTTEKAEVEKVELTADSFSIYTISWGYGYSPYTVRLHYVDTQGNEIDGLENDWWDPDDIYSDSIELSEYEDQIEGYTYRYTTVEDFDNNVEVDMIWRTNNGISYHEKNSSQYEWERFDREYDSSIERWVYNIYFVYEKDSSSGGNPGEGGQLGAPEHRKYIQQNTLGEDYTLTLDVKGERGQASGIDVLLVIDKSGSMGDGDGDEYYNLLPDLKSTVEEVIVPAVLPDSNSINRIAAVSFSSDGYGSDISTAWCNYNNQQSLINAVNGLNANGGTNWELGMKQAEDKLEGQSYSNNKKVVIFLSDGCPGLYFTGNGSGDETGENRPTSGSRAEERARNQAVDYVKQTEYLKNATIYSVYLTDGTKSSMEAFATSLKQGNVDATSVDGTDMKTALENLINSIVTPEYTNVVIEDTLSEYVTLPTDPQYTVTMTDSNGVETTLARDTDYILDEKSVTLENGITSTKITVTLLNGGALADGAVYSLSYHVKPSDLAITEFIEEGDYPHTGDANTDAEGNHTSSGQKGFYSNDTAVVKYQENEGTQQEAPYDKPVVQINPETIDIPEVPNPIDGSITKTMGAATEDGKYPITLEVKTRQEQSTEAAKVDVILVIDRSASMNNNSRLTNTKKAAKEFVRGFVGADGTVSENHRIGIVTFSNSAEIYDYAERGKSVRYFSGNTNEIIEAIDDISADGGTNTDAGFTQAKRLADTTENDTYVIFLTDGVPTFHGTDTQGGGSWSTVTDFNDAVDAAMALDRSVEGIYTIGLLDGANDNQLDIARTLLASSNREHQATGYTATYKLSWSNYDWDRWEHEYVWNYGWDESQAFNYSDGYFEVTESNAETALTEIWTQLAAIINNKYSGSTGSGWIVTDEMADYTSFLALDNADMNGYKLELSEDGNTLTTTIDNAVITVATYDEDSKTITWYLNDVLAEKSIRYNKGVDYTYRLTYYVDFADSGSTEFRPTNDATYVTPSEKPDQKIYPEKMPFFVNVVGEKKDADTSEKLEGATFNVYRDEAKTSLIGECTSDGKGHFAFQLGQSDFTLQDDSGTAGEDYTITVYLEETEAPEGHIVDTQLHAITISVKNVTYATENNGAIQIGTPSATTTVISYTSTGDDDLVSVSNNNLQINYKNESRPDWAIVKWNKNNHSQLLTGARFELYKVIEGDAEAKASYSAESQNGIINSWVDVTTEESINNKLLPVGTYLLKEAEAPDGYRKSEVEWLITVTETGVTVTADENPVSGPTDEEKEKLGLDDDVIYFAFDNEMAYDLPSTGGPGIYWYMLGGVLLMMAGSLLVYKKRRGEVLRRK